MKNILNENYFEKIKEKLAVEKITVEEYKEYYMQLKEAINNKSLKQPLTYINSLMCAFVCPINNFYEEELFITISSRLNNLITIFAKEKLKNIDFPKYYNKIRNILNSQILSGKFFLDNCNLITLAHLAKIDNVDLKEWICLMLDAKVIAETYDEYIKINSERKKLNVLLHHLEHINGFQKKI